MSHDIPQFATTPHGPAAPPRDQKLKGTNAAGVFIDEIAHWTPTAEDPSEDTAPGPVARVAHTVPVRPVSATLPAQQSVGVPEGTPQAQAPAEGYVCWDAQLGGYPCCGFLPGTGCNFAEAEDTPTPQERSQRPMDDLWGRLSIAASEEGYHLEDVPALVSRKWLGNCPLADLLGALYAQAYAAHLVGTQPVDLDVETRRALFALGWQDREGTCAMYTHWQRAVAWADNLHAHLAGLTLVSVERDDARAELAWVRTERDQAVATIANLQQKLRDTQAERDHAAAITLADPALEQDLDDAYRGTGAAP